jgi:hypothetical protein
MLPVSGWRALQKYVAGEWLDVDLAESGWGLFTWRNNSNVPDIAFGTATKCWIYEGGSITDRTPAAFTTGLDHATADDVNYGDGLYGAGEYGYGEGLPGVISEVQSWSFDSFGSFLIACAISDGKLYYYDPATPAALAQLTGSPVANVGVVVTPERFVVALGAGGDKRKLQWADQESLTVWTPAEENQAGSFVLTGSGSIMAGQRGRNETLIWTDTDFFVMQYIGGILVYSVKQVGAACGLIARRAQATSGGRAFWMGRNGFYSYDGVVRPIPCEVQDYVFRNLNRIQVSQIACELRSAYNEVIWYCPSIAGSDNDVNVAYNFVEKQWRIGNVARTAAVDAGVTEYPVAVAPGGDVYEQERGTEYPHHAGGDDLLPYAESGPIEIATGDQVMYVTGIVPDEDTLGDTAVKLYYSLYPTATESVAGPFTAGNPTACRVCGRWVRLRIDQVSPAWKLGTLRLDVVKGGRR